MIELCRTEGQKLLFEGKYDRVVPAALESLKFSIEVYGLSSIELVPSYLMLGEASIGKYKHIWPSSLVKPSNHVCDTNELIWPVASVCKSLDSLRYRLCCTMSSSLTLQKGVTEASQRC